MHRIFASNFTIQGHVNFELISKHLTMTSC